MYHKKNKYGTITFSIIYPHALKLSIYDTLHDHMHFRLSLNLEREMTARTMGSYFQRSLTFDRFSFGILSVFIYYRVLVCTKNWRLQVVCTYDGAFNTSYDQT